MDMSSDALSASLPSYAQSKATYVCPTCEKAFKRPSTLNEHIRATHTSERLICNTCFKAFRRANDLKRHEKLHSGEKAYACTATAPGGDVGCGKRFARLHSLREHQRRKIGSTCWDAFVESQSRSRQPSPRSISAYDEAASHCPPYPDGATIHESIEVEVEVDAVPQPDRPSYKPIDWLNWSMQPPQQLPPVTARPPARSQPIHPSDISWHSVLESRLRHDAESIIASSRNSSFSSCSSYPVSTSA